MKNHCKAYILIAVAILIVILAIFLTNLKKPLTPQVYDGHNDPTNVSTTTNNIVTEKTPTGIISSSTTKGFNLYTNKILGIQFEYPESWEINSNRLGAYNDGREVNDDLNFYFDDIQNRSFVSIIVKVRSYSLIEEYFKTRPKDTGNIISKKVGSRVYIKDVLTYSDKGGGVGSYTLKIDDNSDKALVFYQRGDLTYSTELEKLLSTLKITKKSSEWDSGIIKTKIFE